MVRSAGIQPVHVLLLKLIVGLYVCGRPGVGNIGMCLCAYTFTGVGVGVGGEVLIHDPMYVTVY